MGRLRDTSDLLIDQLRAIDNRRLVGTALGHLPRELMLAVENALREVLQLDGAA